MRTLTTKIPKGWKVQKLKDVLSFEQPRNYIVKSTAYTSSGKTPVLTANKSFILGYTDEDFGIYTKTPVIIFDDFTTDSKYVDFPFKIKSSAIKILTNKEGADLKYIYEVMKSSNFLVENHKRHYISQYQEQDIVIPLLPEQRKIAEILSSIDDEIQKTEDLIYQTEKLRNGLIVDLFTKGIDNKQFKKTKYGNIPKNWDILELREVCSKIGDGLHGTPSYLDESEYYFINGNNISNKKINFYTGTKKVSQEEYNTHKKDLNEQSILLSINGTIGNIGFYNNEKVILGKSVAYINCHHDFSKEFIAYQLESPRVINYFSKGLTGTTIKNLSLATIRGTPIFIPDIKEQLKIVEIISSIDSKISLSKELKSRLIKLKKGVMSDLLSGKVRVIKN